MAYIKHKVEYKYKVINKASTKKKKKKGNKASTLCSKNPTLRSEDKRTTIPSINPTP